MTKQLVTPIFDGNDVVNTVAWEGEVDAADEFLRTLDVRDQTKFQRYFEYLRDGKRIKSPENMRHIKGAKDPRDKGAEVHELKTHRDGGRRLYLVRFENRWYATHGNKKGSERAVPKEAQKAFQIFWGA